MSDGNTNTAAASVVEVAVVAHNVVALFREPDASSEQLSQLVMGSKVRITERADNGLMARATGDDCYTGWMRTTHLAKPLDTSDSPTTTIASMIADVYSSPTLESQLITKLTVSTPVVLARHAASRDFTPILLPDGSTAYTHRANLSSTYQEMHNIQGLDVVPTTQILADERARLAPHLGAMSTANALRFLGTPYLWGGSTPFGIDCSGLVQLAYKIAGVQLLRDAWMQMDDKRFVVVEEKAEMSSGNFDPGDLLFFDSRDPNSKRAIGHVGIAVGDGSFVHAAGGGMGVIVSPCDEAKWTKRFAGARRLSPNTDLAIEAA